MNCYWFLSFCTQQIYHINQIEIPYLMPGWTKRQRSAARKSESRREKKWERELWHDMRKFHSPNQTPIHMWNASEYCETCCAYSFIKKKKRKPSERKRGKEFVEAKCDLQKKIMLCRSSAHLRLNKPQWIWFSIKLQSNLRTRSKSPGFRCEVPP